MKPRTTRAVLLVSAVIFALLFSEKSLGINLVIYEVLVFGWLFLSRQITLSTPLIRLLFGAQLLTLSFTVWHHSRWAYFIHFCVSFLLVGAITVPRLRSLISVGTQSLSNLVDSFQLLFLKPEDADKGRKGFMGYLWKILKLILWPLVIVALFLTLYSLANPAFGSYVHDLLNAIDWFFSGFFDSLSLPFLLTMLIGCAIGTYLFFRKANPDIEASDANALDTRARIKSKYKRFKMRGLLQEYRSAIFLFAALNLALMLLNILDIYHVWIHFQWEGQYLQDFVHQGTYSLIFAIVLSLILVLYFFNGNLSFYSKNKGLKMLCYLWLGQNIFLALSVGLRNWYYIQYYSLAYKRIAVAFFLLLAIYGLYSVFVKIRNNKSAFYLLRKNALVWAAVLVFSAGFNWDRIIASYNFGRGGSAFVHLDFLANLSDSALPELDQPMDKLDKIHQHQENNFFTESGLSSDGYRDLYLSSDNYSQIIEARKVQFIRRWKKKSWLEWNYAEARAYAELTK